MGNREWGMVANYKLLEISCKLMPNAQCPMPNAQLIISIIQITN